jgi:PilZ domain-containing protein
MSTGQVIERRAAQRFEFHLPVSVRVANAEGQVHGFTRDLSAKGAFFYTETAMAEGTSVELTVTMPSQITLTENMRVRCRGKVTRSVTVEGKFGAAVQIEKYEFLTQSGEPSAAFERISALHGRERQTLQTPE